uniref:PDDEXK-like family protein n=1 Tax=Gelidibacter sp. TaxID=2018083 RepID=UPI004049E3EF
MDIITTTTLTSLLKTTKRIVKHHNDLTIAKGEHFNIFSVLKIESRENNTHSAFIAELLDPKGSHKMGDVFLRLFFQAITPDKDLKNIEETLMYKRFINKNKTTVTKEFYIGKRSDKDLVGGRIDIFLKNGDHCICIENKIYAPDQNVQIQRYCNYNSTKNKVFYLTLKGDEPHIDSRGDLKVNEDYYNLSYKKNIIEWLELCLKEVTNFPSLRESINQYILLIKKLTHTLNKEQEKELFDTMINNLEESRFVADNYQKVVNDIQEKFRMELKKRLENSLSETYNVVSDLPVNQSYSKLWIHFIKIENQSFSFCVEPFGGKGNGNGKMFVGLYGHNKVICKEIPSPERLNDVWQHVHFLTTSKNNNLNLNSPSLLKILYDSKSNEHEALVSTVFNQIVQFIEDTEPYLLQAVESKD